MRTNEGERAPLWEKPVSGFHCVVYREPDGALVGELRRPGGQVASRTRSALSRSAEELGRELEMMALLWAAFPETDPDLGPGAA